MAVELLRALIRVIGVKICWWMLDGSREEDGRIGVRACVRRGVLGMIVVYAAIVK